jgi:DNA-binding transcriptional LysR family regulator
MSRTAKEVNLSQPAVTQAIAKLERVVGARLFERRNTGCFLNESGRMLERRTARLFEQIEEALVGFGAGPPSHSRADVRSLASRITRSQIRSLLSTAERGSFAAAARALGISDESLNRAAHDLQRLLPQPVFQRTAQGLSTTPAGTELARRLQLALCEIELAAEELEVARGVSGGRITVGTLPLAGSFLLARAIDDLVRAVPNAHVNVIESGYRMLIAQLRSGALDTVLAPMRYPDAKFGVIEEPLFADPYLVVVRKSHPLTRNRRIRLHDLALYDWVIAPPEAPRLMAFESLFAGSRRKPRTSVQTSSMGIIRALLAESDRVTLLNRYEALSEKKMGILTTLHYKLPSIARNVQVTTRRNWLPTPLQSRFIDLLRKHARRL